MINTLPVTIVDAKKPAQQMKIDVKTTPDTKSNNIRINELISAHNIPSSLFPDSPTEKQVLLQHGIKRYRTWKRRKRTTSLHLMILYRD